MKAAPLPDKIGRYQILERVGRGGMGVLYRGFDPVLDREVAVKVMLTDFSEDAEQMRPRFYREAKAAAKLQHRNIVTVFEFAEEANQPHIVMEFLRGVPLGSRMTATPPLTLDDKIDIVAQLCAGLGYAHSQGVVHRDVKPANVFLLEDGTVKLLDFGIAKLTSSTLTRQGDVLGSASYMSPEQVAGSDSVDGRADVWSAGVVLFELLSGRKPFEGESPTNVIVKILKEEPAPIDTLVPGLPKQLVAVVGRALQKDPTKRIAKAEEFGRELQWIRKALQASGELAPMEETRFASTQVLKALHDDLQKQPTGTISAKTMAGTGAVKGDTSATAASSSSSKKWAIPAGIAALATAGVVAWAFLAGPLSTTRPGTAIAGNSIGAAAANPIGSPANPPPAAATANPSVQSPVPTAATPVVQGGGTASNASTDTGAAVPATASGSAAATKPAAGTATAGAPAASTPKAAPPAPAVMVAVTLVGNYSFEVFDGGRSISAPKESHELPAQPAGKALRIVAPEVFLDRQIRVEGGPGRPFEYTAPRLGKLDVRAGGGRDNCKIIVAKRDLGYPPLPPFDVAAGDYQVNLSCPDGQTPGQFATVNAGEVRRVTFTR